MIFTFSIIIQCPLQNTLQNHELQSIKGVNDLDKVFASSYKNISIKKASEYQPTGFSDFG